MVAEYNGRELVVEKKGGDEPVPVPVFQFEEGEVKQA